mgnify:CR=1 FL=1
MSRNRLLLCTDMDRTILPNGSQPEHPEARPCLRAFCRQPEVCLVYITGRHLALVEQAITDYALPHPDYAITDVGSKIYQSTDRGWQEMALWEAEIAADWQGQSHAQLKQALAPIRALTLQEADKQNRFKLSYYLDLERDKDAIIAQMAAILHERGVHASLIWSVDEPAQIGLLDVLPQNATKLHGLRFLQQHLGYAGQEVLFAGDSGNDLPVLGSEINAVLVANASDEVRVQAQRMAAHAGHEATLFTADNNRFSLGGNYSAGVLQGVWHYHPEFRPCLSSLGCST